MSRENVNPKGWGPPAWEFINAVVYSYPLKALPYDQIWMANFLNVLGDALPCEVCRSDYKSYLRSHPVQDYVGGRQEVAMWLAAYKSMTKAGVHKPFSGW